MVKNDKISPIIIQIEAIFPIKMHFSYTPRYTQLLFIFRSGPSSISDEKNHRESLKGLSHLLF